MYRGFWPVVAFVMMLVLSAPLRAQDLAPVSAARAPVVAAGDGAPLLLLTKGKPTNPEHILMAFYKMAGIDPPFTEWAQKSPYLAQTQKMDRDAVFSREENRMRRAWAEMDTSEPIDVQVNLRLDNYSTIQEMLYLSDFDKKTFFSYAMYGENIAIVPKGIEKYSAISLTRAQMDKILSKTGRGGVIAELLLKPVAADAKSPFVRKTTQYWLMLADIGEIRFWTTQASSPELVWMQRADWYKPKEDSSLMNLKAGGN